MLDKEQSGYRKNSRDELEWPAVAPGATLVWIGDRGVFTKE